MANPKPPSCIYVLAGTNGAGKSSVAGAMFRQSGGDYFNPDEVTARILAANPALAAAKANSAAWHAGKRQGLGGRSGHDLEMIRDGNSTLCRD